MAFRINSTKIRTGLFLFERIAKFPANHSTYYCAVYANGKEVLRSTKIKVDDAVARYKAEERAKEIQDEIAGHIENGYTTFKLTFDDAATGYLDDQPDPDAKEYKHRERLITVTVR